MRHIHPLDRLTLLIFLVPIALFVYQGCAAASYGLAELTEDNINMTEVKIDKLDKNDSNFNTRISGKMMYDLGPTSDRKYINMNQKAMTLQLFGRGGEELRSISVITKDRAPSAQQSSVFTISFPEEGVSGGAVPADQTVQFVIEGRLPEPVLHDAVSAKVSAFTQGGYQQGN